MAKEEQKNTLEENTSEVSSDHQVSTEKAHEADPKADESKSASPAHEELSEREVSAAAEDFYKLVAAFGDPEADESKSALATHEELSEREVLAGDEDFYKRLADSGDPEADESKSALATHEELSERDVFAGDEDFYKRLADSGDPEADTSALGTAARAAATQSAHAGVGAAPPSPASIRHKRFSTLQKVLVAGIVVVAAMLLYALLKSPSGPAGNIPIVPPAQEAPAPKPPVEDFTHVVPETSPRQIQEPESVLPPTQPLSLAVAENFYLQNDYDKAYAAYDQLRQSLPASAEEELMRDFLQLRMALCREKAADSDQASRLFRMVSKSRSPALTVVANHHLSLLEMQKKQYLRAQTKAYQTIALISAVDFDSDWALSLQRDCYFLVAGSMTRNVLSLCDADKDLPEDLWSSGSQTDPFTNLNEAQLCSLLNSGSERLRKALLGPQIQKLEHTGGSPGSRGPGRPSRWSVVCYWASIEELLARFAANAGLDIHWVSSKTDAPEGAKDIVHERPVSLYMPAATAQQFVTVAAGCVGLLAGLDDKGTVNICNPTDYCSLSEHIALLSREALSLWQRFLLTFHGDERIPNAHFAAALLRAQRGQLTDAIAEYKFVANRFSQTFLAPFALLCSSRLKTNLHDYVGAREDLRQLVEQYPDAEFSGTACLYLADATMKAGLKTEAARLYRKVYNFGFSSESQTTAALGAGTCLYKQEDYENAAKWLTRYISLAKDQPSTDLYSAYFLVGKAYLALGRPKQACDALQYALTRQPDREEYVETISALVKAHIQQEHFVEALDILENIRSWEFSQRQFTEILLLKAGVLRAVGLVDKAIAILGDRAQYSPDPQLKAAISFELAKCHIAKENLELAHKNLAEILVFVEPGPLAYEIALELADVCLKLDQNSQTMSICSQLLDSGPSAQIMQRALDLLATAYSRQKNYDGAALALLDRRGVANAPNEKETFDRPEPSKTGQ